MFAHTGGPIAPADLWTAWTFDPGVVLSLAIPAALYAIGARRSRGVTHRQLMFFWSGIISLALALISPLHDLGEALFAAHMTQHEILMLVSAPLLVLSRPLAPMLWALPFEWRRALGRASKLTPIAACWRFLINPFIAWLLGAVVLWVWHAPFLFQATLRSDWVHAAQHISFFVSALLFWWSLFFARQMASFGAGVVYIFTTAIHTSILGALLTFSPRIWYPIYAFSTSAWGWTPLEDQQIGGLIMWVPAGVVYLAAGLWLFALWLKQSEPRSAAHIEAAFGSGLLCALLLASAGCANQSEKVAAQITGGDPREGAAAIAGYGCGTCHTIPGIADAHGLVGPPLAGFRHRTYVAGMLENNPPNLVRWIQHPKSVNSATAMPDLGVKTKDAYDIAAYLYTDW